MMRSLFFVLTALMVIGLAFWAYHENYKTKAAQSRAQAVQGQIAAARERLRVLNAEWAYLNRPDRLRDLAELNFDSLGLMTLQPHQFGRIDQVSYPREDELPVLEAIEVMNREDAQ